MKNKAVMLILSVILAFGLWLYVVSAVNPEFEDSYHNIPVVLVGEGLLEERGLMITSNENPTISLKLKGNRTDLVELKSSDISVTVDVSKISRAGVLRVDYTEKFPGYIADNAIEIQSRSPGSITLVVEEKITKAVDVVIAYNGTLPEDYICDKENVELNYEKVLVTGPKSVVDQITQARVYVDLNDRIETISQSFVYTLCDAAGAPVDAALVKTDVEEIALTLKILRVKEVMLTVEVIDGGGATEKTSSITINPQTIRISGNESMLEKMEDTLEIGTIDLSKLLEDTTCVFPINLPEGITNETGLTEASVDVKFPNLKIKKLSIKNINVINVPEGCEVDMITQMLEIKIRGPIALVDGVKESDISVTVDFAQVPLGTATMRANITINSAYTGVGIVGTYHVSATLLELAEAES